MVVLQSGQIKTCKESISKYRWHNNKAFLPDDVCDAHEAVVNRHAEVVHRQPVGAQQHKVTQCVCARYEPQT